MNKVIHYYSGLTIAVFVGIHLLNHLLILRSEASHIKFMRAARKLYRHPVVEKVIFLAAFVQIVSGISVVVDKWPIAEGWFDWLHIGSGAYLAFFLLNHIKAVLVGRYKLRVDTDLYYGAGVMNMWPHKLYYIPYYALAILSFFTHVACIHRTKMQEFVSPDAAEYQAVGIILLGWTVTFLVIYKMSHLNISGGLTKMEKYS